MKNCFGVIIQILSIVHTVEECPETLAFATEPILASLANVLAYQVRINGEANWRTHFAIVRIYYIFALLVVVYVVKLGLVSSEQINI